MQLPRTSAEQWAVLAAVVDAGGFAQAAAKLHRSQSAVSYAVARLQASLGLPLLEISGRKAVLTPHGQALLKRARSLLSDLATLESMAGTLKQGWEPELRLVVDAAFPRERLLNIVAELQRLCPNTQMQLSDAILSGAEDAIAESSADVVIATRVPPGFLGQWLMDVNFIAVARSDHPLFKLERPLAPDDLVRHVQAVVRDSGSKNPRDDGWLGSELRCTVSSMDSSLAIVRAGLAYAWLPEDLIKQAVDSGTGGPARADSGIDGNPRTNVLRPLPLAAGGVRKVPLSLVLVHPDLAGPAARAAVECFQRHTPRQGQLVRAAP